MATVAWYVVKQKLCRRRRYPLVLMLEPLFRCNLACAGCGKIQYPAHILKRNLSVEKCLEATRPSPSYWTILRIARSRVIVRQDVRNTVDIARMEVHLARP